MGWKVHIEQIFREAKTEIFMINDGVGEFVSIEPVTLRKEQRDGVLGDRVKPMLEGYHDEMNGMLQAIVDAAYEHGIRPKGMDDLTGELGATKFHLMDMREVAKVGNDGDS